MVLVGNQPLTSIRISLCSKTPFFMFTNVTHTIIVRLPTMKPSVQASSVTPAGLVGLLTASIMLYSSRRGAGLRVISYGVAGQCFDAKSLGESLQKRTASHRSKIHEEAYTMSCPLRAKRRGGASRNTPHLGSIVTSNFIVDSSRTESPTALARGAGPNSIGDELKL